jgi:hypothetical protein
MEHDRSNKRVKIESTMDESPNQHTKGLEEQIATKTLRLVDLDSQIAQQDFLIAIEDAKFQTTMDFLREVFGEDDWDQETLLTDPNNAVVAHLLVAAMQSDAILDDLDYLWEVNQELTRAG